MFSKNHRKKDNDKQEIVLPYLVNLAFALYEKKIHLFAYMMVIAIGGLSLTLHFLYNGYFPDLDVTTSITLLLSTAFSSLFLLFIVAVALNINPLIWSLLTDTQFCKDAVEGMREKSRENDSEAEKSNPSKISLIAFLFFVPIIVAVLLSSVVLGSYIYYETVNEKLFYFGMIGILFISYLLGSFVYYRLRKYKGLLHFGWKGNLAYRGILFSSLVVSLTTPFLIWVLYKSKYSIQTVPSNDIFYLGIMITITCAVVLILNTAQFMAVINAKESGGNKLAPQAGFPVLVLLVVVMMSSSYFLFAQAALKLYGLADVVNIDILFSEKGCATLRGFGINYVYNETDKTCLLPHATLVSAIGTKNLILTENGRRFVYSKEDSFPDTSKNIFPLTISIEEVKDEGGNIKKIHVIANGMKTLDEKVKENEKTVKQNISVFLSLYNKQGNLVTNTFSTEKQKTSTPDPCPVSNTKNKPNAEKTSDENTQKPNFNKLLLKKEPNQEKIKIDSGDLYFEATDNIVWSDVSISINGVYYSYELKRIITQENFNNP